MRPQHLKRSSGVTHMFKLTSVGSEALGDGYETALLHLVTLGHALVFLGISGQKVVVRIEILPGRLGSCSLILNFPCLCAILIVCHFCLQTRLWSAKIRPMET